MLFFREIIVIQKSMNVIPVHVKMVHVQTYLLITIVHVSWDLLGKIVNLILMIVLELNVVHTVFV